MKSHIFDGRMFAHTFKIELIVKRRGSEAITFTMDMDIIQFRIELMFAYLQDSLFVFIYIKTLTTLCNGKQ